MNNKNNENDKIKPIKCYKRLIVFVIFLLVCFCIATAKLIEYQIVTVDKYERKAKVNEQIRETIPAARGDIVDRNGIKLATNELKLSLVIGEDFPFANTDYDKAKKEKDIKGNEIIITLIKILDRYNINWDENSPITRTKPYKFINENSIKVKKLKTALKQQQYATATDALRLLTQKFNINNKKYNEQEARDIAVFRANMLVKDFSSYNKSFTVIEKIEPDFLDKITGMENRLKGVKILETSTRTYPCKDIGPHYIGNVGPLYEEEYEEYKKKGYSPNAIVGKFGVEKAFESYLKPEDGISIIEKDRKNNTKTKYCIKEPKPGNTVKLTIDYHLQKALQEKLPEFLATHHSKAAAAKGASACVLDVRNGNVLALVSYPSYDLNFYNSHYDEYLNAKLSPLQDKATYLLFRPGSSFKPIIATMALEKGVITNKTVFECRKGIFSNMDCKRYNHSGRINIYTAIQHSCNNYFYQVAERLGIENIDGLLCKVYIDKLAPCFGFATDTGLEIPNSNGRITSNNPEFLKKYKTTFHIGDLRQTGIGQAETYVTVLQQAIGQLTIANKGKRFAAHIMDSIIDINGNIIKKNTPKIMSELKIDDTSYNTVLEGMRRMSQNRPSMKGMDIATKSGSPQYSDRNKNLNHGTGVGLYPASNPKYAISIFIQDGSSAEDFCGVVARECEKMEQQIKLNQQDKNAQN